MRIAGWILALIVGLLTGCDDGVLLAFEPHLSVAGGAATAGTPPNDSAGLGGVGGVGGAGRGGGGIGGGGVGSGGGGGAAGPGAAGTAAGEPSAGEGMGPPTSPLLIDDFEDGDMRAKPPLGWWYPVNDGTGTQGTGIEPVTSGGTSVYALRTHGSDFSDWGAALGLDLRGESTTSLSAVDYQQLCFVARVEAGSSTSIDVHLLKDPGVHYVREVSLSESWNRYCLRLTDFLTVDQSTSLVPDQLIALQFFFPPQARFELWLDDVVIEP